MTTSIEEEDYPFSYYDQMVEDRQRVRIALLPDSTIREQKERFFCIYDNNELVSPIPKALRRKNKGIRYSKNSAICLHCGTVFSIS